MLNVMTQDTITSDKNNSRKIQFQHGRQKEIQTIKRLIKEGYPVTFSKTNNWIRINGTTYNGFKREMIEPFIEQTIGDNNDL